ncbi:MAG: copper amine oxidase N-terminal domain-containing protein, partial [Oscillospiraceae bacterium]|nr:copper amine oxidase N-terminal domain-containing protein [Oscillospiraceae bacterium]
QPSGVSAAPTASTVLVNGQSVAFDAYNIDGSNYFKLRDLAYVLNGTEKQFEVGWDNASKTITLTSGSAYTANASEMAAKGSGAQKATVSASKLLINGTEVSLTAYNIGGNNYFKLRDIGQTFDFGIGWDNASKTITIDTSTGYTA